MTDLKDSDLNHLRRLLGYVRCEIGQSPEEFKETLRAIAPSFDERPSGEAYARCLETYEKSQRVPRYVREAIKALDKLFADPYQPAPSTAKRCHESGCTQPSLNGLLRCKFHAEQLGAIDAICNAEGCFKHTEYFARYCPDHTRALPAPETPEEICEHGFKSYQQSADGLAAALAAASPAPTRLNDAKTD